MMRGQSLVEFSLSLLFLLLLVVGIYEFSALLFQYVQLRDAAQEGAQYGSYNPRDTVSIMERARKSSSSPINLSGADVDVIVLINNGTKDNSLACEGDTLSVTVRYHHKIVMPLLPQILGDRVIMLNGQSIDTVLSPTCS